MIRLTSFTGHKVQYWDETGKQRNITDGGLP
jgi:hypothetical protein